MACIPSIHSWSVQIPLRFSSKISAIRTSYLSSIHFAHSSNSDCGRCCCLIRSHRMQCFRDTNQQDVKLSEEVQIGGRQSCDEDSNIKNAASDTSLGHQNGISNQQSSIRIVISCVLAAVTFGIALGLNKGIDKASEYFAGINLPNLKKIVGFAPDWGHEEAFFDILATSTHTIYILEQSLSVDNLFVFVLIFNYFKVPIEFQSRVLSYGIAGAIIFRAVIILLGTATIQRFEVVNLLLALILLFSSYKLFSAKEEDTDLADNFIVRTCQKFIPVTAHYDGDRFITVEDGIWKATPLLLTVVVIELSDIAFAVDSIPAVFGVTRDPLIVFSSNMFAILGLRSIYTLISGSMSELEYLQPAIGIVLGFIGTKMISDFLGYHITTEVSLGFVATSISSAVLLSLYKKSKSD